MTDSGRQTPLDCSTSPASGELSRKIEKNVLERIYTRRFGGLFSYILGLTRDEEVASDICQEAFCVLSRKAEALNLLQEPYAYLRTVAAHLVHSWYGETSRDRAAAKKSTKLRTREPGLHDGEIDLVLALEQVLATLPGRVQRVFALRIYEHCSVPETAQKLGITDRTVRRDMYTARTFLERYLLS